MSIEAVTWALNADVGDSTRKLVLIGLANHAHKDGRNSWASKDTIAAYVNCHPKTVRRHVAALIAAGWIREGDQEQVAHLRADRRPVVYDVAMTEATRHAWAAEHAEEPVDNPPGRGDNLSGRDVHGGTSGGTPVSSRGDTAMSPKPSRTKELPPLPPVTGGRPAATCPKPGPTPHPNCRRCGTTARQIEATERRARAEQARARTQIELMAQRTENASRRVPTEDRPTVINDQLAQERRRLREQTRTLTTTGARR